MNDETLSLPEAVEVATVPLDAQPELLEGVSDDALLMPEEEVRKRWTAGQARKIIGFKNSLIRNITSGWPLDALARDCRVTRKTLVALAAAEAEKVTVSAQDWVKILRSIALRAAVMLREKLPEADVKELVSAISFLDQRAAANAETMGSGAGEEAPKGAVVDVAASVRRLEEMLVSDVQSGGLQQFVGVSGVVSGVDTAEDTAPEVGPSVGSLVIEGEGGGAVAEVGVKSVMPSAERAFTDKAAE